MPLDPLNDPLLRAPRSHAPTIAGMTEAANTATPEQLADFVDAIGASGGGGGGGHTPTDLGATATPTGVTVTSSTGTDALLPLATATNAGLMAPAQHAKLADLPTAAALATDQAAQDLEISGKAPATHTHTPAAIGAATTAQGAKADSALQPGALPVGTTLPAAQISDATTPGRALLTATDAAAQRTALALGNVSNTADADKPVSTAQALAITAATTADAIADTLETAPAADLARIKSSVSGGFATFDRPPTTADNAATGLGVDSNWVAGDTIYEPLVAPTATETVWRVAPNQGALPHTALGAAACKFVGGTVAGVPGFSGPAITVRCTIGGAPTEQDINILPGGQLDSAAAWSFCSRADAATVPTVVKVYDQTGAGNHAVYPVGSTRSAQVLVWDGKLNGFALTGDGVTNRILQLPQTVQVQRNSFTALLYGRAQNASNNSVGTTYLAIGDWIGGTGGTYPYPHTTQELTSIQAADGGGIVAASNPTGGNKTPTKPIAAECGPCIVGISSDAATGWTFFVNDREEKTASTSAAVTLSGGYLGSQLGTDGNSGFRTQLLVIASGSTTAAQRKSLRRGAYKLYGIRPQIPNVVVFAGDSRVAGAKLTYNETPGFVLASAIKGEAKVYNFGNGSKTVANITSAQVASLPNWGITGGKKIYVSIVDVNDFIVSSSTAAQVMAAKQVEYAAAKAAGYYVIGVYGMQTTSTAGGGANTKMAQLRDLISAAGASGMGADKLVDVSTLAAVSSPATTAYYPDGLHQSDALNYAMMSQVAPIVDAALISA